MNYLVATSTTIAIIWFAYYLFRYKLTSRRLLLAHLLVVVICILVVPSLTTAYVPTPRRYLEMGSRGFKLSDFFGSMTRAVVVQITLLAASLIFLFLNVRGDKGTTTKGFLETV